MESIQESLPSVIQYYKSTQNAFDKGEGSIPENSDNRQTPVNDSIENETEEKPVIKEEEQSCVSETVQDEKTETVVKVEETNEEIKIEEKLNEDEDVKKEVNDVDVDVKPEVKEEVKSETGEETISKIEEVVVKEEPVVPEKVPKKRGRKRKNPLPVDNNESLNDSKANENQAEENEADEADDDEDVEDDEIEVRPRKRGRCKKNPDIIPSHLSSDIVLGYKILLKFLETPQFSVFHKPMAGSDMENSQITCLNQIKRKFEDNAYKKISDFVNDVREMLTNIYESRNTIATKRALRLEQILEQRIAQLPNYLRPQCALVLSPDDLNNTHNKGIRINKGGGFVSLLLEKAEKRRCEKDKEKRKLLAEERKQLKEEQDKDVQDWEKNVLLKDHEEEIKSMWELPAIGHFIHLCTDILNIGEVAQYEVERMLLMPQCSETLDLIMTALLSNSLVRAKLDRTPPMPYSIWSPLVTTRVVSWYRAWHRECRNEQKIFEEIGVEPDFWKILGPDINPLDCHQFHELSLLQRVWVLKTLCDVDFVRKKTVYDNIRAQTLDELNPVNLGVDRHGNRYIQLKQFCGPDMRIYRQCANLDDDFNPAELIESIEGFEVREGPITVDKFFKDIWDVGEKPEIKVRKKRISKTKKVRTVVPKVNNDIIEKKNLRQSARAKQKSYAFDTSDSDQSDTDLATLKCKLRRADTETLYRPFSDKEFISLSVFRLPREKVNTKQTPKRNSYIPKKYEECGSTDKCIKGGDGDKKEIKPPGFEDEASDSLDLKQMQDMQVDFEKTFQMDDMNEDDLMESFTLDKDNEKDKFTVENSDNLKIVFKKDGVDNDEESMNAVDQIDASISEDTKTEIPSTSTGAACDTSYKYTVPDHLKPDSNKFYLVVDSVDGLRQLISKFASHENDLEIISRSTKSGKKNNQNTSSCEVQLIERLQNLLVELEPWEWDLIKSCRSNREKMYKEYMNFINRPSDFVHPNEAYWLKIYEEPTPSNTAGATATPSNGTTDATPSNNTDKGTTKDKGGLVSDVVDANTPQPSIFDELIPRKRTRVTRLQLKLDGPDDLDEELGEDDTVESSESDDNWELPTSHRKKPKKDLMPKLVRPKRVGRRSRGCNSEKSDITIPASDKSTQSPASDKAKKTLFWGPRSSDPSEDLNWETNRQKILEKHNSPKKVVKGVDKSDDTADLDGIRKLESPLKTVITSPKRFVSTIPGNKKPYFSPVQLKAMEDQAKQKKPAEEPQFLQPNISRTYPGKVSSVKRVCKPGGETSSDSNSEANAPLQTVRLTFVEQVGNSVNGSIIVNNSGMKSCGNNNNNNVNNFNDKLLPNQQIKPTQAITKIVPVSFTDSVNSIQTVITAVDQSGNSYQQPAKIIQHIKKPVGQIQGTLQKVEGQVQYQAITPMPKIQTSGQLIQIQQKPVGQMQEIQSQGNQMKPLIQQLHVQQPINQITQVQIPQSISQIHPTFIQTTSKDGTVSLSNIRVHQPVQLQAQSVIAVQQPVQLQNQTIQIQAQRVATIQQPVQVQAAKVVQQPTQASQTATKSSDNELYLTDGSVLIKADNNFVQQFMQKDKYLTLNLNDKLDLKKPLFIVKPKIETNATATAAPASVAHNQTVSANQLEPSTSQQNIIVFNKSPTVQPSTVPTSVTNIVIPTNYIVSDNNAVQPQIEPSQNLTVVQQNPTFIIRQKPMVNKINQPQVIKIIDPQNVAANQNVILSPANIKFTNQVIRPVNQSVITSEQSKPTLRFIRPPNVIATQSVIQSKMSTVQSPSVSANNSVPVQNESIEIVKSQPSVITSKIVTTSPVRFNSPGVTAQAQPVRAVIANATQPIRFAAGNNATAGIRLVNRVVRPMAAKTGVITSNVSAPVTVVTSVRPPITVAQPVKTTQNLQPSIIKTGQARLQLTPTKIIRANTPLPSPVIIKLDNREEIHHLNEDKSVQDKPHVVDYIQGDVTVNDSNQSWIYVVQTSDGNDVMLTNENVEERKDASSNPVN